MTTILPSSVPGLRRAVERRSTDAEPARRRRPRLRLHAGDPGVVPVDHRRHLEPARRSGCSINSFRTRDAAALDRVVEGRRPARPAHARQLPRRSSSAERHGVDVRTRCSTRSPSPSRRRSSRSPSPPSPPTRFAWIDFKGRKVLFIVTVSLLAIPLQVALIPLLQLYVGGAHLTIPFLDKTITLVPDLDLAGTTTAVWLTHAGFALPFAIFLLHNYISRPAQGPVRGGPHRRRRPLHDLLRARAAAVGAGAGGVRHLPVPVDVERLPDRQHDDRHQPRRHADDDPHRQPGRRLRRATSTSSRRPASSRRSSRSSCSSPCSATSSAASSPARSRAERRPHCVDLVDRRPAGSASLGDVGPLGLGQWRYTTDDLAAAQRAARGRARRRAQPRRHRRRLRPRLGRHRVRRLRGAARRRARRRARRCATGWCWPPRAASSRRCRTTPARRRCGRPARRRCAACRSTSSTSTRSTGRTCSPTRPTSPPRSPPSATRARSARSACPTTRRPRSPRCSAHLPFPLVSNQPEYSAVHLDPLRDGTFDACMRDGVDAARRGARWPAAGWPPATACGPSCWPRSTASPPARASTGPPSRSPSRSPTRRARSPSSAPSDPSASPPRSPRPRRQLDRADVYRSSKPPKDVPLP